MINTKQSYHLEPQKGLLNDPVGLVYFKNRYHVFYQWNPYKKDHSSKEWGHFSSKDLIHWVPHESGLKPDQEYDRNGVYSGSSVVINDRLYAYYTGNRKEGQKRIVRQCLAVSEDGVHFQKEGPVLEVPSGFTPHFRDPRVLRHTSKLEMYIGAQSKDRSGNILKYSSENGRNWTYERIVGQSLRYNMIECPDMIRTDEGNLWLYCLQKRDSKDDTCLESIAVYQLQSTDFDQKVDLDRNWEYLDAGFDCFAAQTLKAPDGRTIMFSWMNRLKDDQEKMLADTSEHIHCLTLPRELSVKNGKLRQKPARELFELFESVPMDHPTPEQREWMAQIKPQDRSFSIEFNDGEAQITWDRKNGSFTLFRKDWAEEEWEERTSRIQKLDCVQIFMDVSSIEVFVNDGEKVLSARIFPKTAHPALRWYGLEPCQIKIYPKKKVEERENDR